MGERGYCSETDALKDIMDTAKAVDPRADVFAIRRSGGRETVRSQVTFAVRTGLNNEALVNALKRLSVEKNLSIWFDGSEVNLQGGQVDTDYLFMTALITPTIN